tara:strand:+ start:3177 stop:4265 length:1089 start_codon:yes stop_codon:yes gene_type:complete
MGISRGTAKFLLNEHSNREFNGSILQLGRQTFYFSEREFSQWAKEMNISLSNIDKNQLNDDTINDIDFFQLLGFNDVYSADFSNYENPNFTFDLNYPIPEKYHNRFDVIYDGGTMEHCFNTFQVLQNMHAMLKEGGRVIHSSPSNNHVDHGFYMFSPTLFADYYNANAWKVHSLNIFKYTQYHTKEPWFVYDYTPGCLEQYAFGGFKDHKLLGIWNVNEKQSTSTSNVIPSQGFYNKTWKDSNETENSKITFDANKKRIKIFGASVLGTEALNSIKDTSKILGFIDNSVDKNGTKFHDHSVTLPSNDLADNCDYILIASLFAPEIYKQLLDLKIPKNKIKCYGLMDYQVDALNLFEVPIAIY